VPFWWIAAEPLAVGAPIVCFLLVQARAGPKD
jgi:hypothetical protein